MILLDYTDRRPIYEQVAEKFQDLILRGGLRQHSPLPSVRSLAMELSINPNTIQRAYAQLEREGWIYSVKGKGSFVAGGNELREGRKREWRIRLGTMIDEAELLGISRDEIVETVRTYGKKDLTDGTQRDYNSREVPKKTDGADGQPYLQKDGEQPPVSVAERPAEAELQAREGGEGEMR